MKKQKKDPVQHEKDYIEFLTKQIEWKNSQKEDVTELKYKLDKAKLVLKLLTKDK